MGRQETSLELSQHYCVVTMHKKSIGWTWDADGHLTVARRQVSKACRSCRWVSLVHGSAVTLARAVVPLLAQAQAPWRGERALFGLAPSVLRNLTVPTQDDLLPGCRGRLWI